MNTRKTLAIAGSGKLAEIIVDAYLNGLLPDYKLIGIMSRLRENAERLASRISQTPENSSGCTACTTINELLALNPDYIVEAASPAAMRELAVPALTHGASIVTLSIGVFADGSFYEEVKKTARENGTRVHLVSGAIGGFDVMRTVALMGDCTASIDTEKGPDSLKGTPVYEENLQDEKRTVFSGSAKGAIELFPTKVNVAVAASLASVGPDDMKVSVTSTPGYTGDDHHIEIKSDEVHAVIDVYSKTAKIAGWSAINVLRNLTSPIVFN